MWNRQQIMARTFAVFVGIVLLLFAVWMSVQLEREYSAFYLPLILAAYGITGIVFGLLSPDDGWRLGLYLFAAWPPVLLFGLFLAGEQPWHPWADLRSLIDYVSILVVACIGGWAGAFINGLYYHSNKQDGLTNESK
jgi:hypothetical protein